METKKAILTVVGLIIVVLVFALAKQWMDKSSRERGDVITYESETYRFGFHYPSGYYLKERVDVGTPERPQLSVVLVEDTEWNRDVVEGRVMEPVEGPTAITIDAYGTTGFSDARTWVEQSTNWGAKINMGDITVSGVEGVAFGWDGLYPGRSVVLATNDMVYVLSVTWMSLDDRIIDDFDAVLASVSFE